MVITETPRSRAMSFIRVVIEELSVKKDGATTILLKRVFGLKSITLSILYSDPNSSYTSWDARQPEPAYSASHILADKIADSDSAEADSADDGSCAANCSHS